METGVIISLKKTCKMCKFNYHYLRQYTEMYKNIEVMQLQTAIKNCL